MLMTEIVDLPKLQEAESRFGPLPAYSLLLGLCKDQLPLILDLTEPRAGSFLIASDQPQINTHLLTTLANSGCQHNTTGELMIHLVSEQMGGWERRLRQPHLEHMVRPASNEALQLIQSLKRLYARRCESGDILPVHLLLLDDLSRCVQKSHGRFMSMLREVIVHGPHVGLWTFATIESGKITADLYETIEVFPSRIVGRIVNDQMARYLTGIPYARLDDLVAVEVLIRAGNDLHSVLIPN